MQHRRVQVMHVDLVLHREVAEFIGLAVGVAAFHAHAELQGYFMFKERLKPDAIIL